ncbi:MAG: alginate lyase family protein [Duncaniella sp.]|nr:alginate lyase family protein [Duncaniella sp.]
MFLNLSSVYSQYNLTHFIDIFLMGQKLGMKLDNLTDSEGRNFYKALDFLASYLGKDKSEWPGQQISGWEEKQQAVARDLWRVASQIDTTRTDYKDLYQANRIFHPADRFTLLYYTPDEVDDAFVNAAASLNYAMKCVDSGRKDEANAAKRRVSPRTLNADGSLALVHPQDCTY